MANALGTLFQDIADAIRTKTGDTATMKPAEFSTQIASIEVGSGGEKPQLFAPSLSRSGSTVTITNPTDNGSFATSFKIYDGETLLAEQSEKTLDIGSFEIGEHLLTAEAHGEKFVTSERSTELNATKHSISISLTNLTSNFAQDYAWHGDSLTITLSAPSGYNCPNNITATMGGESDKIDYSNGVITIGFVSGDIEITAAGSLPSLADDSWETIIAKAKDGTAVDVYSIGEEKTVDLTYDDGTTETITMVLVGFNHDTLSSDSSQTARMSFISKELLATSKAQGSSQYSAPNPNSVGTLAYWLNNDLLSALPSVIRDGFCEVNKGIYPAMGSSHTTVSNRGHKCWMPSLLELGTYSIKSPYYSSGATYPVFDKPYPQKHKVGSDSAVGYWTRDYYATTVSNEWNTMVGDSGSREVENGSYSLGVCFGFCI